MLHWSNSPRQKPRHRWWWRNVCDVGDGFRYFRRQHALSFNIDVGYQLWKNVANIKILSPTSMNCRQHPKIVANIQELLPTSKTCHQHPLVIKIFVTIRNLLKLDWYLEFVNFCKFSFNVACKLNYYCKRWSIEPWLCQHLIN